MNEPLPHQPAHRLFHRLGQRLVELAQPRPGAAVLDVGASIGAIRLCAAAKVGPTGKVVGLEPLPDLLAQAHQNVAIAGYTNVELRSDTLKYPPLAEQSFDVVLSASVIFALPDLLTTLRQWQRLLKPGGVVAFMGFGGQALQPYLSLLAATLDRYGVLLPAPIHPFGKQRLVELEQYGDLLRNSGFSAMDVRGEQFGYYLADCTGWWDILWHGGLRSTLTLLTPDQLIQVKAEHLAAVDKLATAHGIWLNVAAIFAIGQKQ